MIPQMPPLDCGLINSPGVAQILVLIPEKVEFLARNSVREELNEFQSSVLRMLIAL